MSGFGQVQYTQFLRSLQVVFKALKRHANFAYLRNGCWRVIFVILRGNSGGLDGYSAGF
jgi:hypothetical protein